MAIMKPLRQRMGKRTTLGIAAAVWLLGIILSCPNIIFSTTYRHVMADGDYRIICYMEWPDGPTNESMMEIVYVYNINRVFCSVRVLVLFVHKCPDRFFFCFANCMQSLALMYGTPHSRDWRVCAVLYSCVWLPSSLFWQVYLSLLLCLCCYGLLYARPIK